MLHHVSIELPPAEVEATLRFWELLGFEQVEAPEVLAGKVTWLERLGTQIHLIHTEAASIPVLGHAAVVVADFDGALSALEAAGHEVAETRELWGARRAFAVGPGGHRVELMAQPPPPGVRRPSA